MSSIILTKKLQTSKLSLITFTIFSVILALIVGGVFLTVSGYNPIEVYSTMLGGAFGSKYGLSETLVKAIPLALCGLGISLAFRMQLWNIGAEGQFYMGAMAATWAAITFPGKPWYVLLPLMFTLAFIAGGIWGLLPAIPRAFFKVNETITTLMLNYVAILWVDYLVYGPWKDPNGFNFPLTAPFTEGALLPTLGRSRLHYGFMFALVAAIIIYIVFKYFAWGFEVRVIGESTTAAKYAGMNIVKTILGVMFVSGALAGVAGMSEVAGITGRLQPGISPGYGYSAIIVAWLARLHPFAILLVSFLFGGLLVGGYSIQTLGLPAAVVSMLQGLILFFVLGSDIFTKYTVSLNRKKVG